MHYLEEGIELPPHTLRKKGLLCVSPVKGLKSHFVDVKLLPSGKAVKQFGEMSLTPGRGEEKLL